MPGPSAYLPLDDKLPLAHSGVLIVLLGQSGRQY